MDVPLSTAKNSALLRPSSSPLKTSGSRRLAKAAPRQILRCVHAGNETKKGPRPPLLSRTRQHDHEGENPVSRFMTVTARTTARGLAGIGIRRRLEVMTGCGDLLADKFRKLCLIGKRGHQWKEHGPPTLISREVPCTIAKTSSASITMITTQSQFAPPSLAFAPLPPCPCCLTRRACFTAARTCFCKLSSSSERCSILTLGVAFPMGVISCFFAVSSAAASLCRAMTA